MEGRKKVVGRFKSTLWTEQRSRHIYTSMYFRVFQTNSQVYTQVQGTSVRISKRSYSTGKAWGHHVSARIGVG